MLRRQSPRRYTGRHHRKGKPAAVWASFLVSTFARRVPRSHRPHTPPDLPAVLDVPLDAAGRTWALPRGARDSLVFLPALPLEVPRGPARACRLPLPVRLPDTDEVPA